MKKNKKIGRPKKGSGPTISKGIRVEKTIMNAIIKKHGTVQKWIDWIISKKVF